METKVKLCADVRPWDLPSVVCAECGKTVDWAGDPMDSVGQCGCGEGYWRAIASVVSVRKVVRNAEA